MGVVLGVESVLAVDVDIKDVDIKDVEVVVIKVVEDVEGAVDAEDAVLLIKITIMVVIVGIVIAKVQ